MNAIDFTYRPARPAEFFQLAGWWDRRDVPPDGWLVEEKIDGWRAGYWRGVDGKPQLWTRRGHAIGGVGHILHRLALIEQAAGQPLMFDGEYQVGGTLASTKAWCESGWKSGGEAGTLHLFDAMPESEWREGGSDAPLVERKARLLRWFAAVDDLPDAWAWRAGTHGKEPEEPPATILADWWSDNAAAIMADAETMWRNGREGLMLKAPDAGYRRGRSNDWRKVKRGA